MRATSATADHAPIATPIRPWATFTVSGAPIAETEEPPRQCGHTDTSPRRVQHHHRTRVDKTIHRQRDEAPGPAPLTMRPRRSPSVLIRHDHRLTGRAADR